MPLDQYRALVEEYHRDPLHAQLQATIMNASGNYKRAFSAKDFLPETEVAPPKSSDAIRAAMRMLGEKGKNG